MPTAARAQELLDQLSDNFERFKSAVKDLTDDSSRSESRPETSPSQPTQGKNGTSQQPHP